MTFFFVRNGIHLTTDLPVHELARVHPLKLAHKRNLETIWSEWKNSKQLRNRSQIQKQSYQTSHFDLFNSSKSANLQKAKECNLSWWNTHPHLVTLVSVNASMIIAVNLSLVLLPIYKSYIVNNVQYNSLFSLSWVFEHNQFPVNYWTGFWRVKTWTVI